MGAHHALLGPPARHDLELPHLRVLVHMAGSRDELRVVHGSFGVRDPSGQARDRRLLNCNSLNGLAAGPCETAQPQIIADIIFLHDRGKYQTLYFSMYFASLMVGQSVLEPLETFTS
jgi:hypothetical protein